MAVSRIRQKGTPRPSSDYRVAKRNNLNGLWSVKRGHRRARWKALGLAQRLVERRAAP